jgi:hypothetical protein
MHDCRALHLSILLVLLAAEPALAQGNRRKPPTLPRFDLSGTLKSFDGNRVVLTTEAGYTWVLQPKPDLVVELTGKAKPAFLAPAQFVAFLAKLDKRRGEAVEKVTRMTVFTPDKRRQPGILPDLGFGDLEKRTRTEHPGSGETSSSGHRPAAPTSKSPAAGSASDSGQEQVAATKPSAANIESFAIHGRITSVKNGKLLIQVPANPFVNSSLKAEVADDAEIDVELTGILALGLVQPGDHVQARGDQVGEGMGYVNHLTFCLAQPLGMAPLPKKPPRVPAP